MAKKATVEEMFEQMGVLMEDLQKGDLTLEESFQKYEEGLKLMKKCNDSIDKIEKKIIILEKEAEPEE